MPRGLSLYGKRGFPMIYAQRWDGIAEIHLTIRRLPDEKGEPAGNRVVNLKERADIVKVMDWLNPGIVKVMDLIAPFDWSQSESDIAVIDIPQPDGDIMLIKESGATHNYSFSWNGNFYQTKDNRFFRGGDIAKLKEIVQRHWK
jgi:hypothetical protein